jgi:hypothetical protein
MIVQWTGCGLVNDHRSEVVRFVKFGIVGASAPWWISSVLNWDQGFGLAKWLANPFLFGRRVEHLYLEPPVVLSRTRDRPVGPENGPILLVNGWAMPSTGLFCRWTLRVQRLGCWGYNLSNAIAIGVCCSGISDNASGPTGYSLSVSASTTPPPCARGGFGPTPAAGGRPGRRDHENRYVVFSGAR